MSEKPLEKETVRRVADVAHINLTDEEVEQYVQQFKYILETFKELDEVDTNGVKPSYHPLPLKSIVRDDKVKEWPWDPFSNTKHREKDYFRGPRIA